MVLRLPPIVARRVTVSPEGCWLWGGYINPGGYGMVNFQGRHALAHRFAYEWLRGPIPDGRDLDHLCRVRHCINPAHLEPVTRRENLMRGETSVAEHARKTHCSRGHEFTAENTQIAANGTRHCRECSRFRAKRTYQRNRTNAVSDAVSGTNV